MIQEANKPHEKDLSAENRENINPENVIFSIPHATFAIQSSLRRRLNLGYTTQEGQEIIDYRRLRNASDFATGVMRKVFPKDSRVVAVGSRVVGDQNRDKAGLASDTDPDARFRSKDFNGNQVWKSGQELTDQEKEQLAAKYWQPYQRTLKGMVDGKLEDSGSIFLVDIHDTGNISMNKEKGDSMKEGSDTKPFPILNFGNAKDQSCDPKVFAFFKDKIVQYLLADTNLGIINIVNKNNEIYGFPFGKNVLTVDDFSNPEVVNKFFPDNDPYSRGYITKEHGMKPNMTSMEKGGALDPKVDIETGVWKQNAVMLEFARELYMDEPSQKVDFTKAKAVGVAIKKATYETGWAIKEEVLKDDAAV
ncbi:MAG: N-formylglutamate amidohydrolase [bacterium]